jgi:pimeloyl-ACP methyl ester carboxylesterase
VGVVTNRVFEADDGTRLRVRSRPGDMTMLPFVFVHGLASNARLWDQVAEGLAAAGHSSHAVDLRGHGESERPEVGYDLATAASDVAGVVRDLVERRAVLVGQSWGANVVTRSAVDFPEVARGVACVDGGFVKLRASFDDRESAIAALTPPAFEPMSPDELRLLGDSWFEGFPPAGIDAQLANFEPGDDGRMRPRLSLRHHLAILTDLWEHDPDATVSLVDVPVWVLAVEGDRPGRRERIEAFGSHVRQGRVVWAKGHHDIHAQQPELVVDLLLDLAAEIDP